MGSSLPDDCSAVWQSVGAVVKLHLGVMDIPYDDGKETTGEVASFLEERYSVMQRFFDAHERDIIKLMEDSIAGSLENIMAGAPPAKDPFAEAMSEVHNLFIFFITNKKLDGNDGIPTMASLLGISRRLKNKRGPPRPSFLDTGLYIASMRAWVSEVMNAEH